MVLAAAAPLLLGSVLAHPTPHLEQRSGDSTSKPGNKNDVCTLSVPDIDDGVSYGGFVMPCKQDLTCVSTRLAPEQPYALGDILPIGMCLPKKDSKKDADPCYEFAHQKLRPGFWFDGKQVDCGSGKWVSLRKLHQYTSSLEANSRNDTAYL